MEATTVRKLTSFTRPQLDVQDILTTLLDIASNHHKPKTGESLIHYLSKCPASLSDGEWNHLLETYYLSVKVTDDLRRLMRHRFKGLDPIQVEQNA